jgi:GST-like protein
MIDLYFWTTPNGYKPAILLEELGVPYQLRPVNISKGEQFEPEFLKISPNNRIPAIVDQAPIGSERPLAVFESGAILQYLAEKEGQFLPSEPAARAEVLQWLNWQMGGIGPMLGQYFHFSRYAPKKIQYGIERYRNEAERLYGVLDRQLEDRQFVAGDYSIADMAIYPWIRNTIKEFPGFENVERWHDRIEARPAVRRAYERGAAINQLPTFTKESTPILLHGKPERSAA